VRLGYLRSDPDRHGEVSEADLVELYRHPQPVGQSAWVRTNFITSLDGSISGPDGRTQSIVTPSDVWLFALHRAHADVILVGAGTARTEGYRSPGMQPWQAEVRRSHGLSDFPTLAIVTRSLRLDPVIAQPASGPGGPVVVVTHRRWSAADLAPYAEAGIEVLQVGDDEVDLGEALTLLGERGLRRVLCEGGPVLHRDMLAGGLVDDVSLTLAPVVVGGPGQRTTTGALLTSPARFVPRLLLTADDGAVFTSYTRESS